MEKNFYVYILASQRNGTLYIGVTSDLVKRVWEHKNKLVPGFTNLYNLYKLIYYSEFNRIEDAIAAEKKIKGWTRKKKIALVKTINPDFRDLSI